MATGDGDSLDQCETADESAISWGELLAAYRGEPGPRTAGALLERLGPWLTNARKALLEAPPLADQEDVAQQLVVEVLAKAAAWEPGCEDRWIPRRLVEEAERRVRKALRREGHRRPDPLDEQIEAAAAEPELLLETPIGRSSTADLQLIYRRRVLGISVEELARRDGITPRQMRRRIQLAGRRARA